MGWLEQVASVTEIHNSLETIRWNIDKQYLLEMQNQAFPVIATNFIENADELHEVSWNDDLMVKPSVSAGSNDTARFIRVPEEAMQFASGILKSGRAVMVQRYLREIDHFGETGLVYFSGVFSHAFGKNSIFGGAKRPHNGLYVEEEISARVARKHEMRIGNQVMSWLTQKLSGAPLYARVDMVSTGEEEAVIMEVELIEPSLFLHVEAGAAARFAEVLRRLG